MTYSKEYKQTEEYKRKKAIWDRKYYEKHKQEILDYQESYRKKPEVKRRNQICENAPKRKQQRKKYRKKNKEKLRKYNQKWHKKHPNYWKEYYCRPEVNKRETDSNNTPQEKAKRKIRSQKYSKRREELHKKRWLEDQEYRIKHLLRNSLGQALRKYTNSGKIMSSKKYGIDYKAIIEHLKPFPEDMKKYHIDHIKPLCLFDLTDPEEVKKAFAPENHQWLLKEENLKKASKDKIIKNAK